QALDAGAGAGHARDVERSVGDDLAGTCDRACARKGERARLNPGAAGEAVAGGEGENAASDLRQTADAAEGRSRRDVEADGVEGQAARGEVELRPREVGNEGRIAGLRPQRAPVEIDLGGTGAAALQGPCHQGAATRDVEGSRAAQVGDIGRGRDVDRRVVTDGQRAGAAVADVELVGNAPQRT